MPTGNSSNPILAKERHSVGFVDFYSKPRHPDGSKSMKMATLYKVLDLGIREELNIAMEILIRKA